MKALFVITKRDIRDNVVIQHTDDMAQAICMQYALFQNKTIEEVAPSITDAEIDAIVKNLQDDMIDTVRNDDCEVTISFFPPIE